MLKMSLVTAITADWLSPTTIMVLNNADTAGSAEVLEFVSAVAGALVMTVVMVLLFLCKPLVFFPITE